LEAAVAGGEQGALEEQRAHAMTLPLLLDREGGLPLAPCSRSHRAQLGSASQHTVDEEAVNNGINAECELGVLAQELVRYRAGKAAAAALQVEAQQMVAIEIGFCNPQFSNQAAARELVVHENLLLWVSNHSAILQRNMHRTMTAAGRRCH